MLRLKGSSKASVSSARYTKFHGYVLQFGRSAFTALACGEGWATLTRDLPLWINLSDPGPLYNVTGGLGVGIGLGLATGTVLVSVLRSAQLEPERSANRDQSAARE
jgi:hypothetical protein